MVLAGPTTYDVNRALLNALLIPGVAQENIIPEYKEAFRLWGGEYASCVHWQDCGAGVKIFQNSPDTFLLRVNFVHAVPSGDPSAFDRLKDATDLLRSSMRKAIPVSASARIFVDSFSYTATGNTTEFQASVFGIVAMSVPLTIVNFMLSKGIEVVSGERAGWADEQLGAREHLYLDNHPYDYQIWHVDVRLISNPMKRCRVVVERPLNLARPMLVTGLDFDEDAD